MGRPIGSLYAFYYERDDLKASVGGTPVEAPASFSVQVILEWAAPYGSLYGFHYERGDSGASVGGTPLEAPASYAPVFGNRVFFWSAARRPHDCAIGCNREVACVRRTRLIGVRYLWG